MPHTCGQFSPEELLGPLNETEQKRSPKLLFVEGDLELLNALPRVAIVGSRKASAEGQKRAYKLARMLAQRGGIVVSGLAEGIDTAAHLGAVENNGRTIAVIGTPLNKAYPAKNAALQAEIAKNHLLVSQFPSGYPTTPKNFPMRNATMALLSTVSVIVEAGESSGALSQGWEALRLGRPLFIMESVIQNHNLSWPKEMLSYGAQVLGNDNVEIFLDELPWGNAHFDVLAAI